MLKAPIFAPRSETNMQIMKNLRGFIYNIIEKGTKCRKDRFYWYNEKYNKHLLRIRKIIFSKSNYDQMNKTNKFYRVGPHVLRICGIPPMDSAILLPEFAPFILTDEDGEETEQVIEIDIRPGKVCIAEDEDNFSHAVSFEWEDCRCRICQQADGDYQIGIAPVGNPENEACAVCSRRFHHNIIFLPQSLQQIASFIVNNFLMMIYTFATAGQGTLMIHASVIHYNGKGYLLNYNSSAVARHIDLSVCRERINDNQNRHKR